MRSHRASSRGRDLAAIIRHARRHDPQGWTAAVVRNATAAQRQQLLWALVDGWGLEDTLTLLAQAMRKQRVRMKRQTTQNRRLLAARA